MRRHLKIGAGATLELPVKEWRHLMKLLSGHIKIGSNATVRIVPDKPKEPEREKADLA